MLLKGLQNAAQFLHKWELNISRCHTNHTPGTLMSSIITDAKSVDSNLYTNLPDKDDVGSLSRRHPCRFSKGYLYIVIYKTLALIFPVKLSVMKYIHANIEAKICMLTQQNRRGLNRPILRPLWLTTSAANHRVTFPYFIFPYKK